MGQYVVILTISAILLGGVLLYNARASTSTANAELSAYQTDRIAREASQIALRDIVRDLNARTDAWTDVLPTAQTRFNIDTTTYEMDGNITTTYAVTLTEMTLGDSSAANPDRVRLRINGAFGNWNETTQAIDPTDFVVETVYERRWTDVNVSGAFRKAVWSNQDLVLSGNAEIIGDIHTNGHLTANSGSVSGTGTYSDNSESADDSLFSGDPPVAKRKSLAAPVLPPPVLWHSNQTGPWTLNATDDPTQTLPAGDSLVHGWLTDGSGPVIGKGTASDPYILRVTGDLTITGPVRLLGHIRIYVSGNVTLSTGASLSSATVPAFLDPADDISDLKTWADANLPGGVTIGLYASGDVTLNAQTLLAATVYAEGSVSTGSGSRMIAGGLASRQPLNIGGDTKVYYKEGTDSVFDPGLGLRVPESVRLVAYREWACRPSLSVSGCP